MHHNGFVEHRRAPRVDVDLPVLRKVQQRFVPEKALNLSATGVALETSAPLVPGSFENLVFVPKDGAGEVTVQAEDVRVHTRAPKHYVAGLKFAALGTTPSS